MPCRPEHEVAEDLVRRIRCGDLEAENELYQRYRVSLTLTVRHVSRVPEITDDLVQETMRVVLMRLRREGIDEPGSLLNFLRATAVRMVTAHFRKLSRQRTSLDNDHLLEVPDDEPDALSRLIGEEQHARVRRVIQRLNCERDRQILYRVYIAEEDRESIRRDLSLSEHHFNRVLFRARQRFRRLFLTDGGSPRPG